MEVPAGPVTASAVSGRGVQACQMATTACATQVPSRQCTQQCSSCSHIKLLHFIILAFFMPLLLSSITVARDHPQSPHFPSQGIFATLGRAQQRGSTTSRLSWDFPSFSAEPALPDPRLVMLADMSETVTPPAQLPCSS